jgi:hypothetical protein
MESIATLTFTLVAGFVWGGFFLITVTAVRKEGRKAKKG